MDSKQDKKMIPLSVIDALISRLNENWNIKSGLYEWHLNKETREIITHILEELKKEAIPIQTEQSIPMSVIDALTASLKCNQEGGKFDPDRIINNNIIKMLEEIKKEAIPSPSEQDQDFDDEEDFQRWKKEYIEKLPPEDQGLEQKIKALIKQWEDRRTSPESYEVYGDVIDELRKLLE